MYGYALFPMGIHDKAVFGIFGGELLVGWSNFIAAFGGVIPAEEYPACAYRVGKAILLILAVILTHIVVMGANHAYACDAFGAIVVIIYGNVNRVALPRHIQSYDFVLNICKVLYRAAILYGGSHIAFICAPSAKCVARAGKPAFGKRNCYFLVIGCRDTIHAAFAAVSIKCYGIGYGSPFAGVGYILIYDGFCGKLSSIIVEPTDEGIAGALYCIGNIGRAYLCALSNGNGFVFGSTVIIIKSYGNGVGPHGIKIHSFFGFYGRLVGINYFAVCTGGPAGKQFAFAGERVGVEHAFAAIYVLRGGFIGAVVGMQRYNSGRACSKAADIDAVVIFVAAAVFLINYGYYIVALGIDFKPRPIYYAAHAVHKRFASLSDGQLIIVFFGRNLIFKAEVCVGGHGKLQRAGAA